MLLLSPYVNFFLFKSFFTSCYFGIVSFSGVLWRGGGFLGMSMVGKKHVKSQIKLFRPILVAYR